MATSYKEQVKALYQEKTGHLLKGLPDFCRKYHDDRALRLSAKTQYDYASKMKVFLEYLHGSNPQLAVKEVKEITMEDLSMLTEDDFSEFVAWMLRQPAFRNSGTRQEKNRPATADNYLACLSSYLSFFCRNGMLARNPLLGIDRRKKTKRPIIYLRDDERNDYLNTVYTGAGLTSRQKSAWDRSKLRETCMVQILVDTGIRVSELVGLDIGDVDLKHFKLSVQRKGDKTDNVYFSDTTADLLTEYMELRRSMPTGSRNEQALFLVGTGKYRGTRLGVRSVEKMVKKYAQAAGIPEYQKITPHKLRSTYAMAMLHATGNEMIVKEQLGHENVATTALYSTGTEKDKIENRNALFPE